MEAMLALTGATATLLWVLAAILVIAGIVTLIRGAWWPAWSSSSSDCLSAPVERASSNDGVGAQGEPWAPSRLSVRRFERASEGAERLGEDPRDVHL